MSGSIVTPGLRARVRGLVEPVALGFGRAGLTPNALTIIGFLIACVAAVAAATGVWLAAGLLVVFGGVFDLFDGALARATGRVSKLGAFLDSTFDRWGESVVYVGIVWGSLAAGFNLGALLAAAAMGSAFMVSYTRAKAESLGFTTGTGMASVGFAPREVRIAILTVGLVAAGLMGGVGIAGDSDGVLYTLVTRPDGAYALMLGLGAIAILATVTTIQRIVHTINQASNQGQE